MAEGAGFEPSSSRRSAPGPLPSLGRMRSLPGLPCQPQGSTHPASLGARNRTPTSAALRCSSSFPRIRTSTPRQRRDRPRPCSMLSQTTRKSRTRTPTEALGASSRTDAGLCREKGAPSRQRGDFAVSGLHEPKASLVEGQARPWPADSPARSSGGDLLGRGLPFLGSILHPSCSRGGFLALALGLSPAFLILSTISELRPKAAGSFDNSACTSSKQ